MHKNTNIAEIISSDSDFSLINSRIAKIKRIRMLLRPVMSAKVERQVDLVISESGRLIIYAPSASIATKVKLISSSLISAVNSDDSIGHLEQIDVKVRPNHKVRSQQKINLNNDSLSKASNFVAQLKALLKKSKG